LSSKQQPQTKVVEQKPSAASVEVGLASGTSVSELTNRRLSGAQRKRLIKERKMKDGTWTVEKPPGKTPSSKAKGMVASSGGVKRPHSDLSTQPLGKQQPKKPRNTQVQTETYKDALVGIKMAIIHGNQPEVNLDQTQIDIIQEKLLTAVDANPSGETPPQFLYSKFAQGIFWITCANESSKVWLIQTISGLVELWEGVGVTVVDSKDLPKRPKVIVRIPDTSEVNTVMSRLKKQNPELNTSDSSVMSPKVAEKEQTLAFSIDPDSLKALARSNYKAFWGLGRINFWTLKDVKKQPEAENTIDKLSSQ
jgi:hypothetical protein